MNCSQHALHAHVRGADSHLNNKGTPDGVIQAINKDICEGPCRRCCVRACVCVFRLDLL